MAAVCVRHSDVSGVWASLACKCLFAGVGGALACADCHRECHCHSVSPSHNAKGPEIEPRHRLVPAVGIMRLVAGQARLVR